MARVSITGYPTPLKNGYGTFVYTKDDRQKPTEVQAQKVEPRVEVFESKDKFSTFKLETWINIVSCKGDEYTIAGEWTSKDKKTKSIRRTAKLVKNGEGDELYYQKGDEPMRKYLIRPGVSEAVAIAAQEGLLIYNEREKA